MTTQQTLQTEEYKQTELGELPKSWEVVKLGDVCEKITDGTHKTPKYKKEGIPFISTKNLVPFRKDFDYLDYQRFISKEEHDELTKRTKPEKGDILISKCGTIGRTQLIRVNYELSIFVGLALLKLKKYKIIGDYLENLLNSQQYTKIMEMSAPGSTRRTLAINTIGKILIPLPPLPEQQNIAYVLSTVQNAQEKTENYINSLKELKKSTMKHLFTYGAVSFEDIDKVELKETEIGMMPKSWGVVEIKDAFEIQAGGDLKKLNYSKIKNEKYKYPIYSNTITAKGLYGYSDIYKYDENAITITARGTIGYSVPRFEKFNAIIRLLVLIPKEEINLIYV